MYIMYDFRCQDCDTKFEALVQPSEHEVTCRECGSIATRLISAPRAKLDPISGDFPGATLRWERQHEAAAKRR